MKLESHQTTTLKPTLSLFDMIAMIVGLVIGVGIFETPSFVAANAASVDIVLLSWGLGGVMSLIGALCYAELATTYPHPGGELLLSQTSVWQRDRISICLDSHERDSNWLNCTLSFCVWRLHLTALATWNLFHFNLCSNRDCFLHWLKSTRCLTRQVGTEYFSNSSSVGTADDCRYRLSVFVDIYARFTDRSEDKSGNRSSSPCHDFRQYRSNDGVCVVAHLWGLE